VALFDPPPEAVPVHAAELIEVPANKRARVTFRPEQTGTAFSVPIVAVSKAPKSTYAVEADGTTRYEQAAVPPTDVDDLSPCFMPALEFGRELTVTVRNTDTASRQYALQLVGWETPGTPGVN
jgi:hypothetical protein